MRHRLIKGRWRNFGARETPLASKRMQACTGHDCAQKLASIRILGEAIYLISENRELGPSIGLLNFTDAAEMSDHLRVSLVLGYRKGTVADRVDHVLVGAR